MSPGFVFAMNWAPIAMTSVDPFVTATVPVVYQVMR